jgi:hypothetical protein
MLEVTKQIRPASPVQPSLDVVAMVRQRRKRRRRWFLVAESLCLAVLVGSVLAGISQRFTAESFTPLFRIVPIAAALVAAILPIVYVGKPNRRLQ